MNLAQKYAKLKLVGKELALYMLGILNGEKTKFQNDEKAKEIEEKFIPIYENLYLEFQDEIEKDAMITEQEYEKMSKVVQDLLEKNNITEEMLLNRALARSELRGNSGADLVKDLLEKHLKESQKKIEHVLKDGSALLRKEESLEKELQEVTSKEEETRIKKDLETVREGTDSITTRLAELKTAKQQLEEDLKKKWKFEIYGTIKKEDLIKQTDI
ncbi:MAG: hypothetical protein ACQERZ_00405 [Fusobacteriota bacterium]